MTRERLLAFMRAGRYAVQASAGPVSPQAAVVGIAVSDDLEIIFDTFASTRKAQNLRRNPRIALVIGEVRDGVEVTLQCEGLADEPIGDELARLKELYFDRFPDGRERERLPGITYVRVRPTWFRFSDFAAVPPRIVEFSRADLGSAEPSLH